MKKRWLTGTLSVLLLGWGGDLVLSQEITGNHRFPENFEMDGAILRQGWLEAAAAYSSWEDGSDSSLGARVAFSAMDRLEMGGRMAYLSRTRSRDEVLYGENLPSSVDENGLGDLDLYAKFRFRTAPRDWSAGLRVKVPAADERERLGSGSTDYALFLATRRTHTRFAWIGNASVRSNGDARTPGGGSGKTSGALGGGVLFKLSYSWTFMAEGRYETRRHHGGDVDLRLAPSFDFRPTENLALRAGVALGLADGAPDQEYGFAAVFHF